MQPYQLPRPLLAATAALALSACGEHTRLPANADVGPRPTLVEPVHRPLPTVQVAEPRPWQAGETPAAAAGLQVQPFATGLDHPRWLQLLPNGDVLVAETNAPPRPDDGQGLKARIQKLFMKKAGAGTPSANRITLLRDADGDGRAEVREVFAQGLNSPFGMAVVGDRFYVADTDAVLEFAYRDGQTHVEGSGRRLTELPAGTINHHWTKSLIASPDGVRLYATVGSNSNVAENGIDAEEGRAAIWEIDRATGTKRLFATGLRNPNGMAWMPGPGGGAAPVLWTVANERDELGSDLVPDYLTSVRDGAFYGWPYSWYGAHVDSRVDPQRPDLVARATAPDYALGAHVAALGLAAAGESALPQALPGAAPSGVFIGLHGSWNRNPPSGYKVVYVGFADGRPQGLPVDVLTGFLTPEGQARGRPVGVAVDAHGALLVADDVGNTVWRVSRNPSDEKPR
ncbi:PQQ-dependent sugar dehydrogenase [Roseateles cellulosilyticus]|uniref:Sorbosone dehydrogenase family protein n=1 Tax=Pelomonas cellulosilytica TaxID=2906762 RepID=A0ABS8XJU2_9BURK|nr:sorbosone dehydrogenase family protein [Pelomonas sp. P8]MCE4553121.1 sorbosone dehydrogenase family protein [Pelomonas sp. P8]